MFPLTKCATERFPVRSGSLLFWNWKSRSNTFSVTLGRRDRNLYQYHIIAFILYLFKKHGVVDLRWVAREGSRWRVHEVSTWADTGEVDQVQTAPRATARVLKWTFNQRRPTSLHTCPDFVDMNRCLSQKVSSPRGIYQSQCTQADRWVFVGTTARKRIWAEWLDTEWVTRWTNEADRWDCWNCRQRFLNKTKTNIIKQTGLNTMTWEQVLLENVSGNIQQKVFEVSNRGSASMTPRPLFFLSTSTLRAAISCQCPRFCTSFHHFNCRVTILRAELISTLGFHVFIVLFSFLPVLWIALSSRKVAHEKLLEMELTFGKVPFYLAWKLMPAASASDEFHTKLFNNFFQKGMLIVSLENSHSVCLLESRSQGRGMGKGFEDPRSC